MTFMELVKDNHFHIALERILVPKSPGLSLRIVVNISENPTDLLIFPHPDNDVETLQIDFKHYATYSVTFDDYTRGNHTDVFQSESFRV